jgi:hypothetical protein
LDENNFVKQIHNEPGVGRSLILDPENIKESERVMDFKFLSADIVSVFEDKTTEYFRVIRFMTKNSIYKVLIKREPSF